MITFGPRVEIARYSVAEGERVLYGQRIDGAVHVLDIPSDEESTGRVYVVERSVESKAALVPRPGIWQIRGAGASLSEIAACAGVTILPSRVP